MEKRISSTVDGKGYTICSYHGIHSYYFPYIDISHTKFIALMFDGAKEGNTILTSLN